VRGTVVLPHGTGKTKKIAVVTSTQAEAAKKAGADIVGGEEIIEKLAKKLDFDILVATPEMMPKLAKVAKILGPKGLMPNPKSETVTTKIAETVAALKKGKAAFKNDDTGNIHQVVGKISFTEGQLQENIQVFLNTLEKSKPAGLKGKFMAGITVCSTMGKGVKISR
jgi:large subunit ribosomal protein L1